MTRMYSKRLLSPFVGLVQIAESDRAQALSMDGLNWAVRYAMTDEARQGKREARADPTRHYALVATIKDGELKPRALQAILDPDDVRTAILELFEAVTCSPLPFAAADRYEYWLLDGAEERPLALLHSCVEPSDLELTPSHLAWIAIPAAQLDVPAPECRQQSCYVPPVNYRLEKLVEERAGSKPRAAWFDRGKSTDAEFPPCLVREDWADQQHQQLCDRYIRRLAPRLLMVQGLPQPVRLRLE